MVVFCNKSEYCMHRSINILKSYKKGPHRFPSDNFSLWGDSAFSRSPRSSRFYHSAGGSKWRNVNTFSGSGLRGNSNGLLAECLLHRCPLLGPLLLLVFVTSRWKNHHCCRFDHFLQIYLGEHVKMIGTHQLAEVLTNTRWWCSDDNEKHANITKFKNKNAAVISKTHHMWWSLYCKHQLVKVSKRYKVSKCFIWLKRITLLYVYYKNIATGETSQAITPHHFFNYFNFFGFYH